ncbi:unnamed protein product [Paramecium sonneborni]|uniref:Ubiquitin-like protease family profile domain-containing protein n=1 Tax=Paramecium sonneborni TaxID=65129 RepID=A0A8S1PNJ2_9CILI|nr:unnamed protein product [Paramecium sonneborni]
MYELYILLILSVGLGVWFFYRQSNLVFERGDYFDKLNLRKKILKKPDFKVHIEMKNDQNQQNPDIGDSKKFQSQDQNQQMKQITQKVGQSHSQNQQNSENYDQNRKELDEKKNLKTQADKDVDCLIKVETNQQIDNKQKSNTVKKNKIIDEQIQSSQLSNQTQETRQSHSQNQQNNQNYDQNRKDLDQKKNLKTQADKDVDCLIKVETNQQIDNNQKSNNVEKNKIIDEQKQSSQRSNQTQETSQSHSQNQQNNQNQDQNGQDLDQNQNFQTQANKDVDCLVKIDQDQLNNQSIKQMEDKIQCQDQANLICIPQDEIQNKDDEENQNPSIFIELKTDKDILYNYVRVNKDKIMYVSDKKKDYSGKAYQYCVFYDEDYNPNFQIYEGEFNKGKKSGEGKLYGGKSNYIKYEGTWENDKATKQEKKEIQEPSSHLKKRIIIKDDQGIQILNSESQQKQQIQLEQTSWVKYNQQFNQKDMYILNNSQSWFTSSIIDGFVQYLNIESQKNFQYFLSKDVQDKISKLERPQYLFCPSQLYTNMSADNLEQNENIFRNFILEFQPINFRLQYLYSRVYFVINKLNTHWFLIYIDFNESSLNILDSLQKPENYYNTEFKIFKKIFKEQIKNIKLLDCKQQTNGYDCGPFTCLNMYKEFLNLLSQVHQDKEYKQIGEPKQVRQFLYGIFKN